MFLFLFKVFTRFIALELDLQCDKASVIFRSKLFLDDALIIPLMSSNTSLYAPPNSFSIFFLNGNDHGIKTHVQDLFGQGYLV